MTLVLPRIGVFNTTVFRNAAYGLQLRSAKRQEIEERVQNALDFVGLGPKRDQHALTLSSGETQRLGIARALVLEPEILFLDEPTASVDEENTEIIESIVGAMKKQGRLTVIMTTHDRGQAERIADRLLIMKHGRIEGGGEEMIAVSPGLCKIAVVMWYYIAKESSSSSPQHCKAGCRQNHSRQAGCANSAGPRVGRGNVAAQGLSIIGLYPMKLFLCCSLLLKTNKMT